jgi:hypothetical protein
MYDPARSKSDCQLLSEVIIPFGLVPICESGSRCFDVSALCQVELHVFGHVQEEYSCKTSVDGLIKISKVAMGR